MLDSDRFRRAWKNTFGNCWRHCFSEAHLVDKGFREDTSDRRENYLNKKLCSALVVCENAYDMLKVRFLMLYKKTMLIV